MVIVKHNNIMKGRCIKGLFVLLERIIERKPYKEGAIIEAHVRAILLLGFERKADVGVFYEPSAPLR